MAKSLVLTGANIVLYINNVKYKVVQSVNFAIDYGENEIRGIDSPWAQELAPGACSVRGSIQGLRLKMSGGIQGSNMRPLFQDTAASPYISIRIQDRATGEDIILIAQAKIIRETHTIAAKATYKLNIDFSGMIPLMALDRAPD